MKKSELITDVNTDAFWRVILDQFHPVHRIEQPTLVLSPRQARKYLLAYLKVPKFRSLLERPDPSYRVCMVEEAFFQEYFHELYSLGLLDTETLEPQYKEKLPPAFQTIYGTWNDTLGELSELIAKRDLSERFAQLWARYLKQNQTILFLEYFDPYANVAKTAASNDSSEVDKYIYALWMNHNNYKGVKGTKGPLGIKLALHLDGILRSTKAVSNRPWYFMYYESLIKSDKVALIRTVTDMTLDEINEYATDGFLTSDDFPELFSVTPVTE